MVQGHGLRAFTEDEPQEHVEAAKGEEEEGCDEGEVVHVVRENLSGNPSDRQND